MVIDDCETENISKIVDVNEIKLETSVPIIAAVEQCHSNKSAITSQSHSRTNWNESFSVPQSYCTWDRLECSGKPGPIQYQTGDTVASIEAVNNPQLQIDTRPKVFDNITKSWTLLDSGSCVSCTPKDPEDKVDKAVKLKAVNGQAIPTFGTKLIQVRIGRKQYEIEAIKTDIPQQILGWDFFKKNKLGFEWDSGELFITDKKAQSKTLLKFIKIDSGPSKRIESVDVYEEPAFEYNDPRNVFFETECMRNVDKETNAEATFAGHINAMSIHPDQPSPIAEDIPLDIAVDPDADESYKVNLQALDKLEEPYKSLIKKYEILKADFKTEPATDIYHRIETTGEPFKSKVRPLLASSDKSKMGQKVWEEMERLGVIERVQPNTTLQYTSPVHLVKKPIGKGYRVCADFRLLNSQTKNDNYPLPILRSFQSQIKGAKVFSKLDLKSAFHHLPIHPQDVNKTCVLSPWGGAFVYKRLAFGLTNGPASWQKYIDSILTGIDGLFCYLDDILLCSEDVERHISLLSEVFKRLQKHGLTLALDKCIFGQATVDYLGYKVSSTGICPLPKKVAAIQQIPVPSTQKQLLQFLGALNYFRSSLSGFKKQGVYHNAANLLQPLYSAATVPIPAGKFEEVWNNSVILQDAFKDAKKLLAQAAELTHPDPNLPLALMTDASQHSIGAVLLQRSHNGKWSPMGYMSRHLPIDKIQWSTCRKELLAAQAGLRYFITEIYGRHCTIFSDHAPLVLAFKNPQGFQLHDPVAQRALMEIGQFTKDVRHIAGLANTGSDFLSRIPPQLKGSAYDESGMSAELASIEGQKLIAMSPQVIYDAQQQCSELELIKAGKHPTSVTFKPIKFEEIELWCEISQSKPRPFLPKQIRRFVIQQMHYAHKGIKENVRLISSHYYWNEMKQEITRYVQTCHCCQSTKPSKITPPHYGEFEVPDHRFTHCHLDIVGPLPPSEGFKYLLTIQDRTTRLFFALPVTEPSAKACSQQFLLHYVSLFGIPSACTSDQGANFVSAMFQDMQKNLGIKINHTPIYWPQGNGLIEQSHQTLKNSLKAQIMELGDHYQEKWFHYLPWALLGQRTAFNKELKTSSSELALGTHVQVPGSILHEVKFNEEPNINEILKKLEFKNNRTAIPTSKIVQQQVEPPSQNVTHVYVRQHAARGLQPHYNGPFRITSRPTRSTVEIRVGRFKDNSDKLELRSWSDCKPAYLAEDAKEAERPKRGRPSKAAVTNPPQKSEDSDLPFHGFATQPNIAVVDFSRPPPPFPTNPVNPSSMQKSWSASTAELAKINASISSSMGP